MSYQATKEVDETEMHTPNERSQSEKTAHCMIPILGHSGKSKAAETVKRSEAAKDLGGWKVQGRSTENPGIL